MVPSKKWGSKYIDVEKASLKRLENGKISIEFTLSTPSVEKFYNMVRRISSVDLATRLSTILTVANLEIGEK